MSDVQTCPRRLETQGPWAHNNDKDTWGVRDGKRTCSYCGSKHPDDVLTRLAAGEKAVPTDKNYKLYLGEAGDKVYFQHFSENHMAEFIRLSNKPLEEGGMNIGMPGHFYRLPFFMGYK